MTNEVVKQEQSPVEILNSIAESFGEQAAQYRRDILVVSKIKKIGAKADEMRPMNLFEATAYVIACRDIGLNPMLNHVIMLEGNLYITLSGHLQNAHSSGKLKSMNTFIKEEKPRSFKYVCKIETTDGQTFEAEGFADNATVKGAQYKTDLFIRQMAEARSMRRCLSRAFPIGMPSFEDTQDSVDYEIVSTPTLPAENKFKREEVIEEATEQEIPKEEAQKSNASAFREKEEKAASSVQDDPRFKEMFGDDKKEAPKEEAPKELAVEKPGLDQVKRIQELYAELKAPEEKVNEAMGKIKTREDATARISELVKILSDRKEKEDEEARTDEVSAEDASDVFEEEGTPDYEGMNEEQLRSAQAEAKAEFSTALKAFKENPSDENTEARQKASSKCAEINKIMTTRGYAII